MFCDFDNFFGCCLAIVGTLVGGIVCAMVEAIVGNSEGDMVGR